MGLICPRCWIPSKMKSDLFSFLFFFLLYGYMIDENVFWRLVSAFYGVQHQRIWKKEKHDFEMKIDYEARLKKQSLNSDARYIHTTVLESNTVKQKAQDRIIVSDKWTCSRAPFDPRNTRKEVFITGKKKKKKGIQMANSAIWHHLCWLGYGDRPGTNKRRRKPAPR